MTPAYRTMDQSSPGITPALVRAGAAAERLHLPDYGVLGNGHGLIYELNSDQALEPVLRWLAAQTGDAHAHDASEAS